MPGCMRPRADALQALRDQDAVVGVELDDVGHGAERDEVEQAVEPRLGLPAAANVAAPRAARRAARAARRT